MPVKSTIVEIENTYGLHARPCALFVQTASQFKNCDVRVIKDDVTVDGKSIMGLMMLAAPQGSKIKLEVEGKDSECEKALAALIELIKNKFNEE